MRKFGELIRRHQALVVLTGLAVVPLVLLATSGGSGQSERQQAGPGSPGDELLVVPAAAVEDAQRPRARDRNRGARQPGLLHTIANVQPGGRVDLRRSPGGPPIAVLGDRTEFGSDRSFWVARRRGRWLGVPVELLGGSGLAWIRHDPDALRLNETPYWIDADISRRRLALWRGKRVVRRIPVTVGAPGSPTPPGRYSVTDGLTTRGEYSRFYGCCVLALSGHQTNLPPGWLGGDRMAIHGTGGGIGGASSAGCLRASDADMIALFRRIPLGTPVLIRR